MSQKPPKTPLEYALIAVQNMGHTHTGYSEAMDVVIALLLRPQGATVQNVVAATGWTHTQAGLTLLAGLAQSTGLVVEQQEEPERGTVYRIVHTRH